MHTDVAAALRDLHCIAQLQRRAEELLPPVLWDFVAGGSGTETTLAANRTGLDQVAIVPRVLRAVSQVDPGAELITSRAALPIAVAPMAYQRLFHPDGELAVARAAAAAGVPFVTSTLSSVSLEELAAVGGEHWFQLYWLREEAQNLQLVRRAENAGCRVLMVTVDVPIMGRRLRDVRNGFVLPPEVRAVNLGSGEVSSAHDRSDAGSALIAHTRSAFHPSLSWQHIERLRALTTLPIVIKGVLHPADAREAVAAGVDGLVVSNHGGRQLDAAVSSAAALPAVVEAVAGACPVLMDSGVRSGTDVLRALALGATAVLVGRPLLWGLAVGGEQGAARVLSILGDELQDAMRLAGCADLADTAQLTTAQLTTAQRTTAAQHGGGSTW